MAIVGVFAAAGETAVLASAAAFEGRVLDERTGRPIAGAEVTIVGLPGATKTDADGRFTWTPNPQPPFTILIVLPGGRLAKPVYVETVDWSAVMTLSVAPAVSEEVTVAAGVAPSIDAAPAAGMTLVTGREIEMRAPANLLQALENVPGVTRVSEGQAAVPAVRGLARGRTLILIDGGRVTAERRVGPSATFLDPASVEGIDVARGPGSVAYGSDAFGGVISVRTRRPDHNAPLHVELSGTAGAGIPDRRASAVVSKGFGAGGVLAQVHVRDADDYDSREGRVLNSGWSGSGFLLRGERQMGGGVLSVGWQSDLGRDIERPRSNSAAVRYYYPYENSHRFTTSYEASNVRGFERVKLAGLLGAYDQRTDQDAVPTATDPRHIERADISAKDFQIRLTADRTMAETSLELGVDVNGRLGLEAHDINVFHDLDGNVVEATDNLSIDSARRNATGLFMQAQRVLVPRLVATGGARVDVVRTVNEGGFFGDRSTSNGAVSGFGSLTAGPFSGLTFTGQVSRGFRDPTLSDRYFRGPTGRGFVTGNPDLDPETSLQFDVSVRYSISRVRVATYVYHYRIADLVERYETETDFFFFRNRGRARINGVEIEAQADLGRGFALEVNGQFSRGRALDDDTALDDIAAPSVGFVLRRALADRGTAYVRLVRYAEDTRPGPSEIDAPGFTDVDAGASWRLVQHLELRAAARNLLNERYYASPDRRFVLAPGRSVAVTAVVTY